jgi:hypothetical protein
MVEMRNAYEIFVGKPKGKRPLKRNKRTWENVDLIHPTQDRDQWRALVNTVMSGYEILNKDFTPWSELLASCVGCAAKNHTVGRREQRQMQNSDKTQIHFRYFYPDI